MHGKTLIPESRHDNCVALPVEVEPATDWTHDSASEHFVQFYENDRFLLDSLVAFIGAGLRAGEVAIVIATKVHRHALEQRLQEEGVKLAGALRHTHYFALDAAEMLSRFMVNGMPDPVLFNEVVGGLVRRASLNGAPLRAFGEMVALLWAEGKATAAIRLEELWNELGKHHRFSLFCAYPMDGFRGEVNGQPFLHICNAHSRVVPAESYPGTGSLDERLKPISLLQQKATSLEAEIAERKRAECALREQQTKLTVAVAVAQLGIWELDMVSNTLTGSEQFKANLGLRPDEPLSYQRLIELIHPDDRESAQAALRSSIASSSEYHTEYRIVDPAGEVRWIAAMGRCVHNGSHRLLGVILDITERKRAAQILEQTVAERTAELHDTISELEAFSYSISHDMRAPLRSMRGYADILTRECADKLGPECRNYLDRINSSAERMDRLIQDVLTFSRVARNEINLEPVNLDHLVRGILECYPNLQQPQADIAIEGRLPYVLGNAASLTQCLSNLLGNAVKFVAPGTQPRVRLRAEWIDRPTKIDGHKPMSHQPAPTHPKAFHGPMIRLSVQDNGIGVPTQTREKIFGIFQRLSKNYEGTGIGLAIVKKAAERMGGRVGVDSESGQGSTFWLELQAAPALQP